MQKCFSLALVAGIAGIAGLAAGFVQAAEVNVYSSRHYDTDRAIYEAFTEKTGIKVNVVEGKAGALLERLKAEGANSPADILLTTDAANLWQAENEGLFAPVSSARLEQAVPAHLRHPDNLWFGFTTRARLLMYNNAKGRPAGLERYEDLAKPEYKGMICVRSSRNTYNRSLVASLIAANGEEATRAWLKGFVANFARKPQGNDTAQIKAVAAGICRIGIANSYYLARLKKSSDPELAAVGKAVDAIFPNQKDRGTHINISGAGLLKTARNRREAIMFLEFLATPQVQEMLAAGNNEYPVVAGVKVDPVVRALGDFKADTLNAAILGANNLKALTMMEEAGWN